MTYYEPSTLEPVDSLIDRHKIEFSLSGEASSEWICYLIYREAEAAKAQVLPLPGARVSKSVDLSMRREC